MQREWGGTFGARYTVLHFALCFACEALEFLAFFSLFQP